MAKTSEEWIPIRSIENGVIKLDNNYMVTGVKVEPKNIFILDQDMQFNVINALNTLENY